MGQNVVLEFDRNPNISEMDRLQSFLESVQRAFNEFEMTMDDLDLTEHPIVKSMTGGDYRILFDDYGHFKVVTANAVEAKKGDFKNLNAGYARIDQTNIGKAWVEELLVTGSFLADDINAATGSFSKYLTGVNIIGDNIVAGTITADRLVIRDPETNKGILYAINDGVVDQSGLSEDELKRLTLNGKIITAESITADKINVTDLFAKSIASTGDFDLGTGALSYDSKSKSIRIRAKQIDADSGELYLGNLEERATIYLAGGIGKISGEDSPYGPEYDRMVIEADDLHIEGKFFYVDTESSDGAIKSLLRMNAQSQDWAEALMTLSSTEYSVESGCCVDETNGATAILFAADKTVYSRVMVVPDQVYINGNTQLVGDLKIIGKIDGLEIDASSLKVLNGITAYSVSTEKAAISDSLTLGGSPLADFVVSQGNTDGWYWEKWASGKSVAWKQYNITITKWTAWGSLYEASPKIGNYTIPSGIFNQTPNFACRAQCEGIGLSGVETHGAGSSTQTPQFWMLRPNDPGTTGMAMVLIEAVGRWK